MLPVLLSAIRISPPAEGPAHDGKIIGKDLVVYAYNQVCNFVIVRRAHAHTISRQPVPIPSYLIAIAAGNVRYHPCPALEGKTWKSGVWAEPELIDAAYWEFNEAIGRYSSFSNARLRPTLICI